MMPTAWAYWQWIVALGWGPVGLAGINRVIQEADRCEDAAVALFAGSRA